MHDALFALRPFQVFFRYGSKFLIPISTFIRRSKRLQLEARPLEALYVLARQESLSSSLQSLPLQKLPGHEGRILQYREVRWPALAAGFQGPPWRRECKVPELSPGHGDVRPGR